MTSEQAEEVLSRQLFEHHHLTERVDRCHHHFTEKLERFHHHFTEVCVEFMVLLVPIDFVCV